MLSVRGLSLLFVATLALLCVACSGNGGIATGDPQPDPGRTLAEVLDEVDQAAVPDGVDGDVFAQLKEGLAEALAARGVSKFVSAPPTDGSSVAQPEFDAGTGDLSWRYYCTGDYNQNGLVEVADLTPLGQNYNVAGPFDETSSLSVVDGNSDGLIAVTDITPIGQNYGCQVTEYNIYGSDTEGDYPQEAGGGNGGATLLDTVAFSSAINNAGERLLFEVTVTQPLAYYWVRPSDGTTEGTPSALVMASGGVVEINPAVLQDDLGMGCAAGPVLVDGYPGIAFIDHPDGGDGELSFQRALDEQGNNWGEPVAIATPVDGWYLPSLAIIDGNPAVSFKMGDDLYYARANDAQGTSWGAPVVVCDIYSYNGEINVLREVNGRPAIVYTVQTGASQMLDYKRADDSTGSAWTGSAVGIDSMDNGARINRIDFELVGGKPAVAYVFEDRELAGTDYRGWSFNLAEDADGAAWGVNSICQQIDATEPGYMNKIDLVDVDGCPCIAAMMQVYPEESDSIAWISYTGDPTGESWSTPDVLFGPGHAAYETGDILKDIILFTVATTEGTVVSAVTTVENAGGEYGGSLWGAPLDPIYGVDWDNSAQELMKFSEPKAVGSIRLPSGKTVSCYCSFMNSGLINIAGQFSVLLLIMTNGYPEGGSFTMAHYIAYSIPMILFVSLFLST